MKLKELNMIEFLPQYMRQDKTAQGMAYAVTKVLKNVAEKIKLCNIYGRIEELDGVLLDELAWQFNVPEYIYTLDINAKRAIIKNCIETHRQRGTVAAIEKVIADVFGNGYVEEWFNYDMEKPFHFKVHTTNTNVSDSMISEFERLIKSTQNVRSVLDAVVIETSFDMESFQGIYTHIAEKVYI